MKKLLAFAMIILVFSQSAFAKSTRPRRVRNYDNGYSHTVRDRHRGVDYDYYEYEACYENPRRRVVQVHNQSQRDNGTTMAVIGVLGILGGQVVARDNRNFGNFISAVGGILTVAGAIEIADSSEVFYEHNGYNCETYYEVDTRRYRFRRQGYSCTTRRYYSRRWGSTHEYFETTCSGRKYVTFNRHRDIWGY